MKKTVLPVAKREVSAILRPSNTAYNPKTRPPFAYHRLAYRIYVYVVAVSLFSPRGFLSSLVG